jgi:hypothetical protein
MYNADNYSRSGCKIPDTPAPTPVFVFWNVENPEHFLLRAKNIMFDKSK